VTILSVNHVTTYRYRRPVHFGRHRMLLRPRDSFDQRLLRATVAIDPVPSEIRWIHDVAGNCVTIVDFEDAADTLRIESNITLDHTPLNAPDFRLDERAHEFPFSYSEEEVPDLAPAIERHYRDPGNEVGHWARQFMRIGHPTETGTLLMTMTSAIRESFVYARRAEHGTQPPRTTLALRRGTCRDFAVLMIEAVRSLGLAARFVTGYVYVADRDVPGGMLGGGSTHAWCQIYLPGSGWVEFDPTNAIVGSRDLIRVAVARDARQAIPLSGTYYGEKEDDLGMSVEVAVYSGAQKTLAADAL
jgi:transglutaminase-like putative cysteine protease